MKSFLTAITFVVLMSFCLTAQEVATISPVKPKLNDAITIIYNPQSPKALHQESSEIYVVVLLLHSESTPGVIERKMEKSGDQWKTTFTIDDATAVGFLLRFDSGDKIDDNNANAWNSLLYGKEGKPVPDARLTNATTHLQRNYFGFKRTIDSTKAIGELKQELQSNPDNWKAQQWLWSIETKKQNDKKFKERITKELTKIYSKNKNDEKAVRALMEWFTYTGQEKKAEMIEAEWLKKNPLGIFAEWKWRQEFTKEQDPSKRVLLADDFLSRFEVKKENENVLLSTFIRAKEYGKAANFVEKYSSVAVNLYNSIAWNMISKNDQLEKAVAIAKKGMERASIETEGSRLDYVSQTRDQWIKNVSYTRGMIADTYGEGLMKLGRYDEAEKILEESNTLIEGDDPENNLRLAECYIKNGKKEKAMSLSYASIVKGKSNQQLIDLYKSAYLSMKGTAAAFDSVLNVAKADMKKELQAKLKKEKIDKPSVDFSLKSIDGKIVKLSDLKGKVVVLDFWATWCGPCLASFPSLQKVYDRYKDNPNVVILALNTWERVKPEVREQHVKDFMIKNKYSFPVLFDTDIVFQYGVEGIPTKFILGKSGNIRFKDVGFGGAQEMEDKMELQFEMLLNEDVSLNK